MGSLGSDAAVHTLLQKNWGGNTSDDEDVHELLKKKEKERCWVFQMPLHYPRYTKADYENMPEWKIDCLLKEYGLMPLIKARDVAEKKKFAMGAFLWPSQH